MKLQILLRTFTILKKIYIRVYSRKEPKTKMIYVVSSRFEIFVFTHLHLQVSAFGVETLWTVGPSTFSFYKNLLQTLTDRLEDPRADSYFAQCTSVAIQRENTANILSTLPLRSSFSLIYGVLITINL